MAGAGAIFIFAGAIAGSFIYNSTMKNKAEKLEYEAYKMYYGLYQTQPVAGEEQYKKSLEMFKRHTIQKNHLCPCSILQTAITRWADMTKH